MAPVGSGFTYQGRLRDSGGSPVDNTCDLTFSLWDAESSGTQVGSDSVVTGVQVAEGYFTVVVNGGGEFGADAFTGAARWLEVTVQCSGDSNPITLDPRQALNAAPYALSLQPGATISGAVAGGNSLTVINNDSTGRAVYGFATGSGGWPVGVYGESDATTGTGVTGWASATSGSVEGVYGVTASTEGSGVFGYAGAAEGETSGVYGLATSTLGRGVYGYASSGGGYTYGVHGQSDSTDGIGVRGEATATTGSTYGVAGRSFAPNGDGVFGWNGATSGSAFGVYGQSSSTQGHAVRGHATASTGTIYGVSGYVTSPDGRAVHGYNGATTGEARGVSGSSASISGRGVYGYASANTGITTGVYGEADSTSGRGVYGYASATSGYADGVSGVSDSTDGAGVSGYATCAGSYSCYGLYGQVASTFGQAVRGYASAATGTTRGVIGIADATNGSGLAGFAMSSTGTTYGVYARSYSPDGYAGWFQGDAHVQGTLSKTGGSFKIDHPLDPANRYLYHSFVESPDMMNIYNGNVILDANGEAWVDLPDWFEALNGGAAHRADYRYQLTCIGGYAPVYIAQKIEDNRFQIAGGVPGMEVSWQVTGIRHDPWAEVHRIPVEQDKPLDEQGTYLYPGLYGQPEEMGLDYRRAESWPGAVGSVDAARGAGVRP
jgi:hypothetical protein